jgi:hypothetical protein
VARSTVLLLARDSIVAFVSGSRPRTSTRPVRRERSDSTLSEMMSPRPGSENQVSTWLGALAWFRERSSRAARRRRKRASVSAVWLMVSSTSLESSTSANSPS